MKIEQIVLALIDPPEHIHRASMDETKLIELATSIKVTGLISPIVLTADSNGRYSIIAGHRRFVAHEMNRADTIDAIIRNVDSDEAELIRITENSQRDDLTPLEEAVTLARLTDDRNLSTKEIAKLINRSEWYVTRRLQLLGMPEELTEPVHQGLLKAGTALILAEIDDDAHRHYLTEYAIRSGASTWVVKGWVADWRTAAERGEPLPEAPEIPVSDTGQVTVTMPCFTCRTPHDHTKLIIIRVCQGCHAAIQQTNANRDATDTCTPHPEDPDQ